MGPSTEPCGTPHSRNLLFDTDSSILTDCEWLNKYDENHLKAIVRIPNQVASLLTKDNWSIVSKWECYKNETGSNLLSMYFKSIYILVEFIPVSHIIPW